MKNKLFVSEDGKTCTELEAIGEREILQNGEIIKSTTHLATEEENQLNKWIDDFEDGVNPLDGEYAILKRGDFTIRQKVMVQNEKTISNKEIAKCVIEALEADKEHEYKQISVSDLCDIIDSGRTPAEENTPVNVDEVLTDYIGGYKASLEICYWEDEE